MAMRVVRDNVVRGSLPSLKFDPIGDLAFIDEEPVVKMVIPGPEKSDSPDGAAEQTDGDGAGGTADDVQRIPGAQVLKPPSAQPGVGPDVIAETAFGPEPADGAVKDEASGDGSAEAKPAPEPGETDDESDSETGGDAVVPLDLLEALLLSTHHPLTAARLAELLKLPGTKSLRPAVMRLNEQYAAGGRSFRVEQVAGGYQILTLPQYGEVLKKLHQKEADAKLTKAALETLSIIAYKQPILRVDVEGIRGVACGETIRSLMEKHLVKIAGRAEEPGRPILYGTTRRFLELFGLNTLKDLPQPEGAEKPKG
jgi:segregation and condensation protein B